MIGLDVAQNSPLWAALPDAELRAEAALEQARKSSRAKLHREAEISLVLSDDAEIRALNGQWRGKDKATNVLSFPASIPGKLAKSPLLGDIVIAFETMQREAEEESKTLADHFSHLVVHGFLHLIGYDHETSEEAEAMEALEIAILAKLGIANPYANAELVSKSE